MIVIALGSVVSAALSFTGPLVIKHATDWIVGIVQGSFTFDWWQIGIYAAILIGLSAVASIIGDVSGYYGDQLAVRARKQLSSAYFEHLLKLPQRYYDNEITGKIVNRLSRAITDATQFMQFFSNNLLQLLLTVGATIVILMIYSWPLALFFVVLIPTNLYLTAKTSKLWQKLESKKNEHFDIASGRFAEAVGQIRLIKSFGSEKREYSAFNKQFGYMVKLTARQSRHWHIMNFWRNVAFGTVNALILVTLFYDAAHGQITLGDMAMLIALVQQASFPLRNLSFFVDFYQRAVANSKDFLAAMDEEPEPSDSGLKSLKLNNANVTYEKVVFSYDNNTPVLNKLSFDIPAGSKVALVGESGAGKSTIANLLMALYVPTKGSVQIDGQDISQYKKADVRRAISTVFQDASLFSGSIRENIAYGKPGATDDEIMEAAKTANASGFINKLSTGLDTEIGERGIKLSGGQKQRIAIARAVLKDAPILILDEATSSLDSKAESEVQQALDRLMENRTTLIIAHRLSTIAGVDAIITLRNGKVDEMGAPSDLAKTGGIYSQLLELQLAQTERGKKQLQKYEITA